MSYHSILKNSHDYTEALRYARVIADNLTKTMNIENVEVFPYRSVSKFDSKLIKIYIAFSVYFTYFSSNI